MGSLFVTDEHGLYCPDGGFYIDPWHGVERAIITHAHSDHARWGSGSYLCSDVGSELLRLRVGHDASIEGIAYGESRLIGDVRVSLHPAGHILGSAQIRCEHVATGEIWVVSGDYKTERDIASGAFELVKCHTFVTESTFGLPIFHWQPQAEVMAEIDAWWRGNAELGITSVVYAYALGKSQRVIAGVDPEIGPILVHGAVAKFLDPYRRQGVALPQALRADGEGAKLAQGRGLVIAPPSADSPGWLRKFGEVRTAFASGWMLTKAAKKGRGVDQGFVLSDHADWDALLATIAATGAENVGVTHGYTRELVRYLQEERGLNSWVMPSRWEADSASGAQGEE